MKPVPVGNVDMLKSDRKYIHFFDKSLLTKVKSTISVPQNTEVLFLFRLNVNCTISFPSMCYFCSADPEKGLFLFQS